MTAPVPLADSDDVAARTRQLQRLPAGEKPPGPRAALALAKSKTYQAAADAPATLRAYAADLAHFKACARRTDSRRCRPPRKRGAHLAAGGLGYTLPTLRRRVAAIARASDRQAAVGRASSGDPRNLRGVARTHGEPARRSAALTTPEIRRLVDVCSDDLASLRDRALLLIGFAGALRRSELVGRDVEHIRPTTAGIRLMVPRPKTDAAGEDAEIGIAAAAKPRPAPYGDC